MTSIADAVITEATTTWPTRPGPLRTLAGVLRHRDSIDAMEWWQRWSRESGTPVPATPVERRAVLGDIAARLDAIADERDALSAVAS